MKLHQHFSRKEFACQCGCGHDTVDAELLGVLINLREQFKEPIMINSGTRCKNHNAAIGGAVNSKHLIGKAADIKISGIPPEVVAKTLENLYPNTYGIGMYTGRTHIDVRATPARWDKRVNP